MSQDIGAWGEEVTAQIFHVTFDAAEAGRATYLKELADELREETSASTSPKPSPGIADRILIARLSLDPTQAPSTEDAEHRNVLTSLPRGETSWDYLLAAYRRCRSLEGPARKKMGAEAQSVLEELRSLLVSYLGLVLQTPDMFPNHVKPAGSTAWPRDLGPLVLVKSLLNLGPGASDAASSSSLASDWASLAPAEVPGFLLDLTKRFEGEELGEILGPAFQEVSQQIIRGQRSAESGPAAAPAASSANPMENPQVAAAAAAGDVRAVLAHLLGQAGNQGGGGVGGAATAALANPLAQGGAAAGMSILDLEWRNHAMAVVEACELKPIASMTTRLPSFNPASATGATLETTSLLGPIIRLSSLPDVAPSIAQTHFLDYDRSRARDVEAAFSTIRSTLQAGHALRFRLFNLLVRAEPSARQAVLAYWSSAVDKNKKRGAMRVRRELAATDGFMLNLYELLVRFCEPFMDAGFTKIDRIDVEYLRHQKRYDVSDLTRLNATEQEAKEWAEAAPNDVAPANFITETFYLATRFASLGLGKTLRNFNDTAEDMRRLKKRADEYEADRASWAASPQAAQFEAWIKRARDDCRQMQAELLAYESQLLDPDFMARVVHFASFVMNWLVRVAEPKQSHPRPTVELPLPAEAPLAFRMLPEHIFEDVCEALLFFARYRPDCLTEPSKNDLITFCTVFLSTSSYIKNPFLKAKLAEILFLNVQPYPYQNSPGVITDVLHFHPLALQHLVPALMAFWIEAESTGSHTQFYDKFNIRYHLAGVFRAIWSNPHHTARLHQASSSAEFVVFVNRLLNDVTFLLDDSLEKLKELHGKQARLDELQQQQDGGGEERAELESHIRGIQGHIRSMLQFGHEFLRTLIDFTGDEKSKDGFMQPEIVSRLAPMLDYNLDVLVGPRCQELKVKDPTRVGFDPKHLLRQILSVYLNLLERREFMHAIARDERSYRREIFEKAARIASRHMLKSPVEIEAIVRLVGQVEDIKREEAEEEEDLGEVPDDFTDPLMATLMREPVILPSSKTVVDLSTIKSHLLSDASDPFNRMPLKLEEVQPATELKSRIEAWIKERKMAKESRQE